MTDSGIYKITHLPSGYCYIGSAVNVQRRWWQHQSDLRNNKHRNPRLQNFSNKYGIDTFTWSVLEVVDRTRLQEREQYFINSEKPFFNIYLTAERAVGGGARVGHVVTPETREKLSKAITGKKLNLTDEQVYALSQRAKARRPSVEELQRRSQSMRGKNTYKRNRTHCIHGHLLPMELRADGRRKNCSVCASRRFQEWKLRRGRSLTTETVKEIVSYG